MKIGNKNYKIVYVEKFDDEEQYGETDVINQIIKIKKNCPKEFEQEVLYHEVCHAIIYQVKNDLYNDENFIISLSLIIKDLFNFKKKI